MHCKLASLPACVSLLAILTGCASSGLSDDSTRAVSLPPLPADLRVCFARQVAPPPAGELTRAQVFAKIRELKASADGKERCGARLACWYDDIARGFAAGKDKRPIAPDCAVQPKR